MAAIGSLQSHVLSSCSRLQLGLLCREPISSYRSALSIPAISSSSSSSSTFPTYALSSLRLNPGLPYVTYLCSSFSRTRRPGHNESFIQRSSHEPKRHIAKVINLDKKAWKSSGGTRDQHKRSLRLVAKANDSTADEPLPSEMSLENALKLLGVGEGASFEEILRAKKVMVDKSDGDQEQITQLEAAYDMLLMQSLSQRRAGKVVDNTIRFADVRKAKLASSGVGPEWLKKALKNAPVSYTTPSTSELTTQTGIFAALIIWTFVNGVMATPSEASLSGADVPGLILAIGFGLSLYFLRKQNLKLGKASLITIGGLVSGALLGGLVESWLRVDIVPVLGIGSPAIVVSEFVLFSLWFTSLYLR